MSSIWDDMTSAQAQGLGCAVLVQHCSEVQQKAIQIKLKTLRSYSLGKTMTNAGLDSSGDGTGTGIKSEPEQKQPGQPSRLTETPGDPVAEAPTKPTFRETLPLELLAFEGLDHDAAMELPEEQFDAALQACINHSTFQAFMKHQVENDYVEDDYEFGNGNCGDPLYDLLAFMDWLKTSYIYADQSNHGHNNIAAPVPHVTATQEQPMSQHGGQPNAPVPAPAVPANANGKHEHAATAIETPCQEQANGTPAQEQPMSQHGGQPDAPVPAPVVPADAKDKREPDAPVTAPVVPADAKDKHEDAATAIETPCQEAAASVQANGTPAQEQPMSQHGVQPDASVPAPAVPANANGKHEHAATAIETPCQEAAASVQANGTPAQEQPMSQHGGQPHAPVPAPAVPADAKDKPEPDTPVPVVPADAKDKHEDAATAIETPCQEAAASVQANGTPAQEQPMSQHGVQPDAPVPASAVPANANGKHEDAATAIETPCQEAAASVQANGTPAQEQPMSQHGVQPDAPVPAPAVPANANGKHEHAETAIETPCQEAAASVQANGTPAQEQPMGQHGGQPHAPVPTPVVPADAKDKREPDAPVPAPVVPANAKDKREPDAPVPAPVVPANAKDKREPDAPVPAPVVPADAKHKHEDAATAIETPCQEAAASVQANGTPAQEQPMSQHGVQSDAPVPAPAVPAHANGKHEHAAQTVEKEKEKDKKHKKDKKTDKADDKKKEKKEKKKKKHKDTKETEKDKHNNIRKRKSHPEDDVEARQSLNPNAINLLIWLFDMFGFKLAAFGVPPSAKPFSRNISTGRRKVMMIWVQ